MLANNGLANTRVLVTRPAQQAEHLTRLIEAQSGKAIRFPAIEILEPPDKTALLGLIAQLDQFDMAIFISPNAVNRVMPMIRGQRGQLPEHLTVVCVGRGTARELKRFGIGTPIVPKGRFDSEALLGLPELGKVRERKIIIFRGVGGRELLGSTLRERGAHIHYAECYRRERPTADITPLLRQWARGAIDIVTVTSSEGLRNLFDMAGESGQQLLRNTPVVVISKRMAEVCRQLGFHAEICIADDASDESIVKAIRAWRMSQNSL